MSEDHFRLIYEGTAVDDGEMEVSQLAPSLLALGKLLEAVDAAVFGDAGRVRVKVRADVRRGSFDVGIALDFVHAVKAWLLSPDAAAISSLVTITGITGLGGAVGLLQLVRWLGGRKIKAKVTIEDGNVRIETIDGDFLVVAPPVARIVDDQNIRQHLERFTEPLRQEGVSEIRFSTEQGTGEIIRSTEAEAFAATAGADPTSQARFEATYQIKRLYFERGKKWRLSNGAQTILAEITDERFWDRVEAAQVAFSADDYLVCAVRMDQWLGQNGLRTEYIVEHVLEHIPAARQDRLPGT
jgi:hypothetical protein